MNIDPNLKPADLAKPITRVFDLAQKKVRLLDKTWDAGGAAGAAGGAAAGAPVFTVQGKYTSRGWTEWTQGFQYGCAILAFDATGDRELLDLGRRNTLQRMAPHVTHTGVHDHGFNNLSTYGNLRRLMREGKIPHDAWEMTFYELAIKCSGAVQAARWSGVPVAQPSPLSANSKTLGYIYSFNGPHSLFVDTMRTLRILGLSWQLGHHLAHENDRKADLLKRSVLHSLATNQYLIFHGRSESSPFGYDHTYERIGRTAHEATFNRNDGVFRSRATQQGYSPFSTWTRGLAWAILGFAEQLEFLETIADDRFEQCVGLPKAEVVRVYEQACADTCHHYVNDCAAADGIVYWDEGAPGLAKMGDWRQKPADPFNDFEPVDSSASAIAAQGMLRWGAYVDRTSGLSPDGRLHPYAAAGLTIAAALFSDAYLAPADDSHQGLLLHSIYHRPNNWDYIPPGRKIPCGESSMWGDYHLLELAVYLNRLARGERYLAFA